MIGSEANATLIGREVLDRLGRAMGEFSMLREGDRVAVAVSGGKDSLCLAHALAEWRKRAPFACEILAVTLDQGKFTGSVDRLGPVFEAIGLRWELRSEPRTLRLVSEGREHGCDVCSRYRRGGLYALASELECNVLALGHTSDDCAESLFRNVLFNGRIAALPSVAHARKGPIRVIRPLVYVSEAQTSAYAEALGLPLVGCVCGEKEGPRRAIRDFLSGMSRSYPGVLESVMSALGNVTPYTLLDSGLSKAGADLPAFLEDGQTGVRESRVAER